MHDHWLLFRSLLQPWTRHVARRVIAGRRRSSDPTSGRFTRLDTDRIVSAAWMGAADLSAHLPSQPTVGSRINVRLACLTLAFFRALVDYGVARVYAIDLTADITWSFYKKWGALRRFLKREDPLGNFKSFSLEDVVPLSFPFNPPRYLAHGFPTPEGSVSKWSDVPSLSFFDRTTRRTSVSVRGAIWTTHGRSDRSKAYAGEDASEGFRLLHVPFGTAWQIDANAMDDQLQPCSS